MRPAVSIIVPVYNVESYLRKCLDSILSQTLQNIEIIVVNDGSTDESRDICNYYEENDNRVKVIHKENGGLSSARNAGMKIARGEYFGFVDGDDWIEKKMYERLYNLCLNTGSDISICNFGREINDSLVDKEQEQFIKEMDNFEGMRQLFRGVLYRFSACNKLFKRNCFNNILFPEGRIHEDLSTIYKVFANSRKIVYSNFIGYIYVKRQNSILNSRFNEKRLDAFLGWEEILPFMNVRYPKLSDEVNTCFVYGCVDNINYILNQVENKYDRIRYLNTIQQLGRKYLKEILDNNNLTLKHKYIIFLFSFNINLFLLSKKILSKRL